MSAELDLNGLLVSPLLGWTLVALALGFVARRLLRACGAYRLVWHPALWDLALFVLLVRAVSLVGA